VARIATSPISSATIVSVIQSHPISLDDCFFYHTIDIPGVGLMRGQWDLRSSVDAYLGGISLAKRRVLEIGPASGFLTFLMEQRGADVVACELPHGSQWDLVPYAGADLQDYVRDREALHRRLVNGFWFGHRAFGSTSSVVYSPVYDLPREVGTVDLATFSMVLRHLREPFRALEAVQAHVKTHLVITELFPWGLMPTEIQAELSPRQFPPADAQEPYGAVSASSARLIASQPPVAWFAPDAERQQPRDTWWDLTPSVLRQFLGVLGFRVVSLRYHFQVHDPSYQWTKPQGEVLRPTYHPCFTIVAERTRQERSSRP